MDDLQKDAAAFAQECNKFEDDVNTWAALQDKALHHMQDFEILAKMVSTYEQRLGMRFQQANGTR